MKNSLKIWLITFAALSLIVILCAINIFYSVEKNLADSDLIDHGHGWTNNESHYSGSEANALFKNTNQITLGFNTKSKADQSVEITIDKDKYTISSPNISSQQLTISVDKNKAHTLNIKHVCTHEKFPCELKLTKLMIKNGTLLPYHPIKKTITVLGDSISTLYGAGNYTFLVAQDIGYELHNASILGSTISEVSGSDNLINRYKKDLKGFKSDTIIIFSGTNDITQNVPIEKFKTSYSQIVKGIKSEHSGSKIFLVGILPRKDVTSIIVDDFNNAIKALADENKIDYVSVSEGLSPSDFLDAIHPLLETQRKIADNLGKQIR